MYVKIINGQPAKYTLADLRADHPNTSFPNPLTSEVLVEFDLHVLVTAPEPEFDPLISKPVLGEIALIDGNWTQTWVLEPLSAEDIRAARDELLQGTDWWCVTDRQTSQAEIDYRQALRDVPQQAGFPNDVNWPEMPQ